MLKGYGAVILDGAWLTLQLALSSMAMAIVLGLIGVALRLSPVRWLAWLGDLYSTVIRGIPDLVLILLIFYGGQDLLNRVAPLLGFDEYIDLNPLAAGIGTLGFIFGAYLSETFRGAFMAIPGFTNNWLVLTKATALISVVGLQDMMFKAKQAADATREPFTFFLAVAAMYLVITSVSLLALRHLEKRYSVGVRAADL